MSPTVGQRVFALIARIGADANDELRLQKTLLVISTLLILPVGPIWGESYIILGDQRAGMWPFVYSSLSLINLVLFAITRRYEFFRFNQLALLLLIPFCLTLALGGFTGSSAVIVWSLLAPFSMVLFAEPRRAPRWFLAYLVLIVAAVVLQPFFPPPHPLPALFVRVFFALNLGLVSSIAFMLLYYFVRQKNLFQDKSENLLLNILPKEVIGILKNESRVIADHYAGASILFADVVGFTPLSAQMSPVELVELLNEVFSHFDMLAELHHMEKIKTIGDCYMVASGVPCPRPDHAPALARMALEMQAYVSQREFHGRKLAFRIGINSGPVIAGVIGRKKFIYDLWGDAVNTASRMESHGVGGTIQITRATYELIKDDFVCEPKGTVEVKGKGEMEVWHVVNRKT
jgi:adenylate cyclase